MDRTITLPPSPKQYMLPRPSLLRAPPSALETGHEQAVLADRYESEGDFGRAAELASKAAESYKRAADGVPDRDIRSTMFKLSEDYERRAKELLRKKDRAERQAALLAPVAYSSSASSSRSKQSTPPRIDDGSHDRARSHGVDRLQSAMSGSILDSSNSGDATPRQLSPAASSTASLTSTIAPGESFMFLGDRERDPNPDDPFNEFWKIMQDMLQNLSQPVAFASAPLNGEWNPEGDTKEEDQEDGDEDDELGSDSFYIVEPESPQKQGKHAYPPRRPKTQEELQHENASLKINLDAITRRLEACQLALRQKELAERMNIRRLQGLQGSMLDVRQRMQSSMTATVEPSRERERERARPSEEGTPTKRMPSFSPKPDVEAELSRLQLRVKELEEDNKRLKADNEKNAVAIAKYKERWEKLKEGARKKRELRAANSGDGDTEDAKVDS